MKNNHSCQKASREADLQTKMKKWSKNGKEARNLGPKFRQDLGEFSIQAKDDESLCGKSEFIY